MENKQIADLLYTFLANTYALYIKTQNYHWNVTGQLFPALHEMFGALYKELAEAVDEIAEMIRQLGVKVPASLKIFAAQSHIDDGNENLNSESMIADLKNDHKFMAQEVYKIIDAMGNDANQSILDLLISRLREHEKNVWMLESSL